MKKTYNRNLKTLENKTGRKIKSALESILEDHEQYKNCYFWTPPGDAWSRRKEEFATSLSFLYNGDRIEISQNLELSCKNFYYSCDIRKNGKKSNIKLIKNIIE